MILTKEEIVQFQYILPVQGSLESLELVESILEKTGMNTIQDSDGDKDVDFTDKELTFIKDMIFYLDSQKKLNFQSLSLIKKILNKGDNSNG